MLTTILSLIEHVSLGYNVYTQIGLRMVIPEKWYLHTYNAANEFVPDT